MGYLPRYALHTADIRTESGLVKLTAVAVNGREQCAVQSNEKYYDANDHSVMMTVTMITWKLITFVAIERSDCSRAPKNFDTIQNNISHAHAMA